MSKAYSIPQDIRQATGVTPSFDPDKLFARINSAFTKIGRSDLETALGPQNAQDLLEFHSQLKQALAENNSITTVQKLARSIKNTPEFKAAHPPSPEGTSGLGGYAFSGVLSAITHFAGASNPVAGAALGIPATLQWLYTHPTTGSKILTGLAKAAPIASQALKQTITHIYNPDTQTVEPVPQQ